MIITEMENILTEKGKLVFKIYSLEYTIIIIESEYIIYPNLYPQRKYMYNSLKELLDNHLIYGECIADNIDRVTIIK